MSDREFSSWSKLGICTLCRILRRRKSGPDKNTDDRKKQVMETAANSQSGTNRLPPPYSEVASTQDSVPKTSVTHVQATHATYSQHHGTPVAFVPAPVITQQPGTTVHIVTTSPVLGPNPIAMVCNACGQRVTSKVVLQRSPRAHLCALALCLIGFWPCAPLVYCMGCCMNADHYCARCNAYQGTYLSAY